MKLHCEQCEPDAPPASVPTLCDAHHLVACFERGNPERCNRRTRHLAALAVGLAVITSRHAVAS